MNTKENYTSCLYSKYTETTIFINDIMNSNYMSCSHENSPHFNETINELNCCRLFIDSNKYILKKDRKNKLDNLF